MYSIGILSTILFALLATTNAFECRPVPCMIHCPYGFDVDTQGCEICDCRRSSSVCIEPIYGYNCGLINRDCPNSHECHLDSSALSGQCCLKQLGSSTVAPQSTNRLSATNTTTTRHTTTTTRPTTTTTHRTTTTTRPTTTTTHRTTTTTRPTTTTTHRTTTTTRHTTTTTHRTTTTTKHHTTTRRALNRLYSVIIGAEIGSSTPQN